MDMIAWTNSRSKAASPEQDDNPFEHVWSQLSNVGQLLESENLREFTEENIQYVAEQLREIIIEIRDLPDKGVYMFALSRDAMLKHLRNGVIELYLALDQLEKKGRTSRFYKYLLNFQEYFQKAYEQKVPEAQDWKNLAAHLASIPTKQHSANFFTQLWKHREELMGFQEEIEHVSQVFSQEGVQLAECEQAMIVLYQVNSLLEEQCHSLNSALSVKQVATTTTLSDYQLMVALCYAHEQAQKLVSLLTTFRSIYRSKSKQPLKVRLEVAQRLDLLTQSWSVIIQKMQHMAFSRDQTRFQQRGAEND
jgi:hypothetical protein